MRDIVLQDALDALSLEEKKERTSAEAMRQRWIIVKEYDYWMLCRNEYPRLTRWGEQYVLWKMTDGKDGDIEKEFFRIAWEWAQKWYYVSLHPQYVQSCSFREHWHVYEMEEDG